MKKSESKKVFNFFKDSDFKKLFVEECKPFGKYGF